MENIYSVESTIEDLFSTEASKKKWMQEESKKEEDKGTVGSLRKYFKLKDGEAVTMDMVEKELAKLKSKYIKKEEDDYPINILGIVRKLNLAKVYLKASEKRKKKNDKKSTEEDMELFLSEESLNFVNLEEDTLKTAILNYFE